MDPIREITEDDVSSLSEINYQSVELMDSIHQLREEVREEILAKQLEQETSSSCFPSSCSCRRCLKAIVFGIVVGLIWATMSIPTVFYVINVVRSHGATTDDYNNTSNQTNTTQCKPQQYSGSVCRDTLSALQQCANTERSEGTQLNQINITTHIDQKVHEDLVGGLTLLKDLDLATEQCWERLQPFACLYLFPLQSCEMGEGEIVGPSRRQCLDLRDDLCQDEWKQLEQLEQSELPQCETLPEPSKDLLDVNVCNSSNMDDLDINCSQGFFLTKNSTCAPECQQWSPYSPITIKVTDILTVITASFALVSGIVVIILGCIQHKRIFTYPSIFIIYQTFPPMMIALLVLVGFGARSKLFCTSRNLVKSVKSPSTFCIITGIGFHYFLLQLLVWWVCHITALFQGTLFPFHTKGLESRKKLKYIHATMFVLGLVLPAGPVGLMARYGGFSLTRQPTFLCTGVGKHSVFAGMVVPISLVIGAGSTMLVFILWTVIKRHIQARENKLRVRLNWTAEAKVLAILSYFVVLGAVALTILTNSLTMVGEFFDEAKRYFICEASGTSAMANSTMDGMMDMEGAGNGTACDRKGLEGLIYPIPTAVAFVLLGLYPTVNLAFIINIKELRKRLCCREQRKVQAPQYWENNSNSNRRNIQSGVFQPVSVASGGSGGGRIQAGRRTGVARTSFSFSRPAATTFKPLPPMPASPPPSPPPRVQVPLTSSSWRPPSPPPRVGAPSPLPRQPPSPPPRVGAPSPLPQQPPSPPPRVGAPSPLPQQPPSPLPRVQVPSRSPTRRPPSPPPRVGVPSPSPRRPPSPPPRTQVPSSSPWLPSPPTHAPPRRPLPPVP